MSLLFSDVCLYKMNLNLEICIFLTEPGAWHDKQLDKMKLSFLKQTLKLVHWHLLHPRQTFPKVCFLLSPKSSSVQCLLPHWDQIRSERWKWRYRRMEQLLPRNLSLHCHKPTAYLRKGTSLLERSLGARSRTFAESSALTKSRSLYWWSWCKRTTRRREKPAEVPNWDRP